MSLSENLLRILIVDDSPEVHQDFIRILTKDSALLEAHVTAEDIKLPKFQITTASQGQEGVELIAKALDEYNPYALAFIDMRMPPGWDGIETIKHIWALDPDVQIVICTTYSDYTWEEIVEELGQKDNLLLLKKPFDQIAVRQLSCALTKKWKLLQEAREYNHQLEKQVDERTKVLQTSLKKIEYQATHDLLTDLPNRALLYDRILQAIAGSIRDNTYFGILFFDLDRFKLINDSYGHAIGDQVLQAVASRVVSNIRGVDTFARISGDEFVCIVTSLKDEKFLLTVTRKLLDSFRQPFVIADREFVVTTSIGIAIYNKDGKNPDMLLSNADSAMYRAKEKGGNQFQFYTQDLVRKNIDRLQLEDDIYQAIENNQLELYYQPQFNIETAELMSAEALIRWNHPEKGFILPIDFLPLAEEVGLMNQIGEWVIKTACCQNKVWQDAGLKKIRVSINMTGHQLKQPDIVETVTRIITESGLHPEYLEIELTENAVIHGSNSIATITKLKALGVHIALDDFGTGYSSINYLQKIPVDKLKIDRSFIKNIDIDRGDEVLIQAIISTAQNLNLEVVAEGVETQKQVEFLKARNCSEVQGFYFSKPLPHGDFEKLLRHDQETKEQLEMMQPHQD